jgi:hypothetical protein
VDISPCEKATDSPSGMRREHAEQMGWALVPLSASLDSWIVRWARMVGPRRPASAAGIGATPTSRRPRSRPAT